MYAVEDILNNPDVAIEVLYQIKKERARKGTTADGKFG